MGYNSMVSGCPKSTGIPRVDRLSKGPLGFGASHLVVTTRLEVDQEKVSIIETLMPPTTMKVIRSFLGHAGFYRRFIKTSLKYQGHYAGCLKRKQKLNLMKSVNVHLKRSRLGL